MGKYEKKLKQWYSAPGVESVLAMHAREADAEIAKLQRENESLKDQAKDLRASCEQKQEIIDANESLARDVLKLQREKAELVERVKAHNSEVRAVLSSPGQPPLLRRDHVIPLDTQEGGE